MSDTSLQASFWIMVLVQTIGSVDMPGSGARKMPAPRQYVAIVVAWLVLFFIAAVSVQARRAASAVAWAIVLAGMVVGPFGKRLVDFLNKTAGLYRTPTPASQPSTTTAVSP